jgi:hypothetical protein
MTMDDEWGRPTEVTGEYARPSDLKGHLLIVYPIGYVDEIQTQYGPSDAIVVDVVDLDDKDEQGLAGKVYRRSTFFQNLLIGSLKSQIGTKVLGVMGQSVAKQGRNPGWIIVDMSGDPTARERASAWKQTHPNFRASLFSPRDMQQQGSIPSQSHVQQQAQSHVQQQAQRPAQQAPVPNATLDSMSYHPVAGSATLSDAEKDLLQQFRARRNQAGQQDPFEDQAPF